MKKTGVWLDKKRAIIVTLKEDLETFNTIMSNIEQYRPRGGSGTRFKGGPQDVVQDSSYLEREKHQLKAYFKSIAEEVNDTDALVVFGPAETKKHFVKELHKNYNAISTKLKRVKTADSMTDNQVRAWVRDFFKSNNGK